MKYFNLIFFLGISLSVFAQKSSDYKSKLWVADNGDGTYTNPILYADYSDPDVVRKVDDYFMVSSSFNSVPGLPILHSKDMVNWKLINHALPQLPEDIYDKAQHGTGVWAPNIVTHDNYFYIYWADPDFGIYMVRTKDPFGDWEDPILVMKGKGIIDPTVLWGDDGKAYLAHAYAKSRAGVNSLISVCPLKPDGTKVLGQGRHVFDGHNANPIIEGPKLYKRNGYYYIFAPAGGVSTGWQLILRSKNIYGPYEQRVVLEQGSTDINGPHQGAWVETTDGEDWFYHFQDVGVYGRIVRLEPMHWKNNWPVMGEDKDGNGIGEPVKTFKKPDVGKQYPIETPAETDEFTGKTIGLQWQWNANPKLVRSAKLPGNDYLRLFSGRMPEDAKNLWDVPQLLLQKFPAPSFTATSKISLFTEGVDHVRRAGLIIFGEDYATLSLTRDKDGFLIKQTQAIDAIGGKEEKTLATKRIPSNSIVFRVKVNAPDATCQFSYSEDGKNFTDIGKPFKAKVGKWVGARMGLFSISKRGVRKGGYADIQYFRIAK